MKHSILLLGQSNMAGRGFPQDVEPIDNKRLYVLRNGRWRKLYVPVNADRVTAGINLSESFAQQYAQEHDVDVGIIPCADGGSSLDMWQVGGLLFDHACYMAELASRTSTIVAVLWHQGESDTGEEKYPLYEEKLKAILAAFREKLNLQNVPFLLGGLGDYLQDYPERPEFQNYTYINQALQNIADTQPMTGYVPAHGLTANPDGMHFSAPSLREFGLRYYAQFLKLEDKERVFTARTTADENLSTGLEQL